MGDMALPDLDRKDEYKRPEVVGEYLQLVVKSATAWKDRPTQDDFTNMAHRLVREAPNDPTTTSWAIPYLEKHDPPKTQA